MLGTDRLGATAMDLFTSAWSKDIGETYGSAIKAFFWFWKDHGVPPCLGATVSIIARYIAWHGLRGTVKAHSMKQCLSAINGFYRDHGVAPVAQGDLTAKMRKGLAASHVEKDPPGARIYAPTDMMVIELDLAERLREKPGSSFEPSQHLRIVPFRVAVAVLGMQVFYARGNAGVQCDAADFIFTPDGSLLMNHRGVDGPAWRGAQQ
eukprot:jgi/Tetstr1/460054/TSEL_005374.t1